MRMGQKASGGLQMLSNTPREFHNRPAITHLQTPTTNKHAQKLAQPDYQKPLRLDIILEQPPVGPEVAEKHTWNPEDRSLNIYVKSDDPFTLHRHPVAQSTDCIRGRQAYERGLHVWELTWSKQQRGTHAVVGVGEKQCTLHCAGYMSLVGNSKQSWGWDIGRLKAYHDNKVQSGSNAQPYPVSRDQNENFSVPDKFLMVLDMDEGTLSYVVDGKYLGVAFGGLKGKKLYPMVSAVWGHCEVGLRYIGGLEPEPLPLMDICRRNIRRQMGKQNLPHVTELPIPTSLKGYLLYK
ncbi:SPRY domain-containing SOCS box protein 1-like [Watersipora subatra]|uniref:SPRY domain-containing SOCS box protein 1-like n=1 Tax=Watersipora subatra TaxID=2589382 RepID=UPI00355C4E03